MEQIPSEIPNTDWLLKNNEDEGSSVDELEPEKFKIAGFWRRILAVLIDITILALPFFIFGFAFRDLAFSLGPWGRLLGYTALLLYWGFFNSRLGKGQTFGKKITRIAVVDKAGNYLPVRVAMLRALILVSIGLLNGWAVTFMTNPIISIIVTTIVFGGGLALIYGLVFNRRTRQGIHDLVVSSYVTKTPLLSGAIAPPTPRIHITISYGLVGLGLVLALTGDLLLRNPSVFSILEPDEWEEIQQLQTILLSSDEFFSVGVQRTNRQLVGNPGVIKDLNIQVWVKQPCVRNQDDCLELSKRIAKIAFEEYDEIEQLSGMRVSVINAFDLGLARGDLTFQNAWSIEDWNEQLEQ